MSFSGAMLERLGLAWRRCDECDCELNLSVKSVKIPEKWLNPSDDKNTHMCAKCYALFQEDIKETENATSRND